MEKKLKSIAQNILSTLIIQPFCAHQKLEISCTSKHAKSFYLWGFCFSTNKYFHLQHFWTSNIKFLLKFYESSYVGESYLKCLGYSIVYKCFGGYIHFGSYRQAKFAKLKITSQSKMQNDFTWIWCWQCVQIEKFFEIWDVFLGDILPSDKW